MDYARFRSRLGAHILDILLMIPLIGLMIAIGAGNQSTAILLIPFQGLLLCAYTFYFHAKSGQTLGKRWLGIKVVTLEGGPIGYAGSFRRNLIMLCESLPWIAATMIAALHVSEEQFSTLHGRAYTQLLKSLQPAWYPVVAKVFAVLLLAEIVSIFLSKRNQSLHDFIAGTVVVKLPPRTQPHPPAPTPAPTEPVNT